MTHRTNRALTRTLVITSAVSTLFAPNFSHAADGTWIDAGANDDWTTTQNWAGGIIADAIGNFGDGSTGGSGVTVANEPQTVTLSTGTVALSAIRLQATGNRVYTFNTTNGSFFRLGGSTDVLNGASGPYAAAIFNVNLQTADVSGVGTTGNSTLTLSASNVTYNGNFTQQDPADVGRVTLTGDNVTLNGANQMTGATAVTNLGAGTYIVGNALAFGDRRIAVTNSPTVSFAANATIGNNAESTGTATGIAANTGLTLRNYTAGNTERVVTFNSHMTGSGSTITIDANPLGGTSAFRAKLLSSAGHAPAWVTLAGTVIEMAGVNATTPLQFGTGLATQGVAGTSGAGRVEVTGTGLHSVTGVWSHTGGTRIQAGELRMIGSTVGMPETGELFVNDGAYFTVSGKTVTAGKLTGGGTVHLSNDEGTTIAGSLTLNQGVAPGSSIGDISVSGTGTLILGSGGTSTFELGDSSLPYDQVILDATADLTLGGTLQILDAGGLEPGSYTLFDLNGGAVSGNFAGEIGMPNGFDGTVSTASGDVVLTVTAVPEPTTIAMLGLASVGLLARRRGKAC